MTDGARPTALTLARGLTFGALMALAAVTAEYILRPPSEGIGVFALAMVCVGATGFGLPLHITPHSFMPKELVRLCAALLLFNALIVVVVASTYGWQGGTAHAAAWAAVVSIAYPFAVHLVRARSERARQRSAV